MDKGSDKPKSISEMTDAEYQAWRKANITE